jgi:hypothetical protein
MSNNYVLAANADRAVAQEVAQGFGLDLLDPAAIGDRDAAVAALAGAANLGLVISRASPGDTHFVALLQALAAAAPRAQLIAVDADARAAFPFLPAGWAHMTLDEARNRLAEMARRKQQAEPPAEQAALPEPEPDETPPLTSEPSPPEAASSSADAEADQAPTPEQVRDYVRAEMRAYYDDKRHIGAIRDSVDANGLSAFAAETLAAPEPDDLSHAAMVLQALMRLALGALHARGLNLANAGFGAVADEAARLAGAADIDTLADMMRAASEQDEDPMSLVRSAAARLADEAAPAPNAPPPQEQPSGAEESFGAEAPPEQDAAPHDDAKALDELEAPNKADAWSEDDETPSPPLARPAPGPSMPPASEPPAPAPAPQSAEAPVAMGRARGEESGSAPSASKKAVEELRGETGYGAARDMERNSHAAGARAAQAIAPADASAFAPKKLRRGAPELVQVVIHQPKDLKAVIKAARKADARAEPAPSGVRIGDIAIGASIGVSLEARGAACDGEIQRRTWSGDPLAFAFPVEAAEDAKQVVFIARVFVGDAQIGLIGFTRAVIGSKPKPAGIGDALRMKRHKRVFLSYSSKDRETVSTIATAYEAAGVAHFFDRTSLKSGEEWNPRLRKEIDRSDLFHLCWSKSAAQSEWVEKEAAHAIARRKHSNGKTPAITVQMLDGPPWAPHPPALDTINFDDFVRAAIIGYARGDGS